jgi:hypothetical protein
MVPVNSGFPYVKESFQKLCEIWPHAIKNVLQFCSRLKKLKAVPNYYPVWSIRKSQAGHAGHTTNKVHFKQIHKLFKHSNMFQSTSHHNGYHSTKYNTVILNTIIYPANNKRDISLI